MNPASSRLDRIAHLNAQMDITPSAADLVALHEHNAASWGEYVYNTADDAGVDLETAAMLFELLGETEAFDGFVTSLEDAGFHDGDHA